MPVWFKFYFASLFRSEDIEMKKECFFHGYDAMISMENLENQTFNSKNHILGLEWDADVKLALISLWLQKFSKCISCCICKVSLLVGDRYPKILPGTKCVML